jgi:hypothetical protein
MRAAQVVTRAATRALVVALIVAAGCGGSSGGGDSCPTNDLPQSCPASVPSYANDIAPILNARCAPCHYPGGIEDAAHDYSTYAHVHAQRGPMLDQIYACSMPPSGSPAPTPDERAKLLAWFVCGAPNN